MDWREQMLREFDVEMPATRRLLERVPMEKGDFRPHPRSTNLGTLATHVARLPGFISMMLSSDDFDFATADPAMWAAVGTKEELLAAFDESSAAARAALVKASPEQMNGNWTMRTGERVHAREPRWLMYRRVAVNHIAHHRGQLGVYLRLLEVPLPSLYGPTADEPMI